MLENIGYGKELLKSEMKPLKGIVNEDIKNKLYIKSYISTYIESLKIMVVKKPP